MRKYIKTLLILVMIFILCPKISFAQERKNRAIDIYDTISITAIQLRYNRMSSPVELDIFKDNLEVQMDKIKSSVDDNSLPISSLFLINQSGVQYISHRGANYIAPENTIAAFEAAAKLGYKYIETDIQLTLDGCWVIMHDDTVDRMTNGKGKIANMTLAQIKALNIDAGNKIDLYPKTKVPTLEEYLVICKKYDIIPFIDIKSVEDTAGIGKLLLLLEKYGLSEKCEITSSDCRCLKYIRSKNKGIELSLIVNYFDKELLNICREEIGDCKLSLEQTYATQANIEQAHLYGVKVAVWTVTSDVLRDEYISYDADFIITDNLISGM